LLLEIAKLDSKLRHALPEYVANTPTTKICSEYQQEDGLITLEKIIGKFILLKHVNQEHFKINFLFIYNLFKLCLCFITLEKIIGKFVLLKHVNQGYFQINFLLTYNLFKSCLLC